MARCGCSCRRCRWVEFREDEIGRPKVRVHQPAPGVAPLSVAVVDPLHVPPFHLSHLHSNCSFVSLRRVTWAPQRHRVLLGPSSSHVKSVIALWFRETQVSIQRWCFLRLAAAAQHGRSRRKYRHLWRKHRSQKLIAAITSAWRSIAHACRVARAQLQKTVAFGCMQACAKCFQKWSAFARVARDLQSRAEAKSRFNMLFSRIHRWRIRVASSRWIAAALVRLRSSCQARRLLFILRGWKSCMKRALFLKNCNQRLYNSYRKHLLRRVFHFWLLRLKKLNIFTLSRRIILQDQVSARSAVCIARFWTKSYVSHCFRIWAALSRSLFNRNSCATQRFARRRLHVFCRTWLNVAGHCRKRRWSCSLLVTRYRHHLQRSFYCAWAASAKRSAHARMWLEALCGRWQDNLLLRRIYLVLSYWHQYSRSCRVARFASQRAMLRALTHSSIFKRRVLDCWRHFKHDKAQKRYRSRTGELKLLSKTHVFLRQCLSGWLQHCMQRKQSRILMYNLNRACDRMLESKDKDILKLDFTKWRRWFAKQRARRASAVRVELMLQVCLLLAAIMTLMITLPVKFSIGLLHAPFVCGPIASSGFQHDLYMVCRHYTHNCTTVAPANATLCGFSRKRAK
jgi:hypothetical protein